MPRAEYAEQQAKHNEYAEKRAICQAACNTASLCLAASPAVTMPAASHARGTPREPLRGDLGRQEARNGIHRRQSHVMAPQGGSQRVTRHAGASPACRCDAGGYAEARRRGHRADVCPGAALAWLRAALAGCRHDGRVVRPMPSVRNVCVVCVSRARCQTRARDGRMWNGTPSAAGWSATSGVVPTRDGYRGYRATRQCVTSLRTLCSMRYRRLTSCLAAAAAASDGDDRWRD